MRLPLVKCRPTSASSSQRIIAAQWCAGGRFGRWQRCASQACHRNYVVDDGSTDGTVAELERTAAEVTAESARSRPRCSVVRTENRGVAAARNTGVAKASAPLIAFLDSDDLWGPHKLDRQVEYMKAHRECAIAQTEEIWVSMGGE